MTSTLSFCAEPGKNRLLIVLKGTPDAKHFARALGTVRAEVLRLHPPFDILSDVRELESFDECAARDFMTVLNELLAVGVRRRVTIVGKSVQGALHMERVARQVGHDAHLAFSLDEAEQVLQAR